MQRYQRKHNREHAVEPRHTEKHKVPLTISVYHIGSGQCTLTSENGSVLMKVAAR